MILVKVKTKITRLHNMRANSLRQAHMPKIGSIFGDCLKTPWQPEKPMRS